MKRTVGVQQPAASASTHIVDLVGDDSDYNNTISNDNHNGTDDDDNDDDVDDKSPAVRGRSLLTDVRQQRGSTAVVAPPVRSATSAGAGIAGVCTVLYDLH
jgi:hypothetical protein